ncbi:hypothetical protein H0H93_006064 [Arthromyces matolae]|nr:hypothetical protein H0H93_006064 [Arthromyces matolae]
MADPSPFIPPLPNIAVSPSGPQQPVIPDPPADQGRDIGWGARPQHPGSFPIQYPASPFTGPGFIPNMSQRGPPPPVNVDYAYPGMTGMPAMSPWSAPVQQTPWPGMGHPRQAIPQQPHSGGPYGGAYPPHQGAWPMNPHTPYAQPMHPGAQPMHPGPAPAGWGAPVHPAMHNTPAAGYGAFTPGNGLGLGLINYNFDGPGWNTQGPPAWGGQMGPQGPGEFDYPAPQRLERPHAHGADRIDPFAAGPSYGPVLDPFQTEVLRVQTRVNPLLEPVSEQAADKPHLEWNMLYPSNDCHLSTDAPLVSWSKGRDQPATFPRVSKMNIISQTFPWSVEIEARDPAIGVTCGEVLEGLAKNFQRLTSKSDFEALRPSKQNEVAAIYSHNRSRRPGVPGGMLKEGMRRLDFLVKDIKFGGVYVDNQLVYRLLGMKPPCTYILKCMTQYAMMEQELEEDEARRKAAEEDEKKKREEEARRRRQATVEDDVDSGE